VDLDYRYAAGDVEQLKTLAQELMALNPDVYGGRGGDIGVGPAPAILPGLGGARCLPAPGPAKRTSESRCGGNWACQGRVPPHHWTIRVRRATRWPRSDRPPELRIERAWP
jgi:hypothetical protein